MTNGKKILSVVAMGVAVALSGAGCGTDGSTGSRSVTTVRHNADGTVSQNTVWMSDDEVAKLVAQREQLSKLPASGAAASLDTSCAGASFWLFDGANQTGDLICFAGPGNDYAGNYSAPLGGTWYSAAKSYWAGQYDFIFEIAPNASWIAGSAWFKDNMWTTIWLLEQS